MDDVEKSVSRLTLDNWPTWSARMEAFLQLKDCWAAVLGTEQSAPRLAKALAYIKLAVSDHYLLVLQSETTAHGPWGILQRLFQE